MITNTLNCICRLLLCAAATSGCLVGNAFAQDDDVVGTWNCSLSMSDPETGANLNAEFEQTYDDDGTYARAGELNIVIEAFEVDTSISLEEAGTWRMVDAMVLGETMTEITFESAAESPSQVEQMMLQQMQAQAQTQNVQEQTATINSLTATAMELEDDDGGILTCDKA